MEIFNNLCRACNIEKDKSLNIHNSQQASIKEMLEYCLQTTITNESKFPHNICYDCIKQLEISYRFIKRFDLAQREFEETYDRLQKINVEASDASPISEDAIEESIDVELDEKSVHVVSKDVIEHTENVDKFINNSSNTYLPPNETKRNQQLNNFKASSSSIIEVPSTSFTSPAIICSHCNKTFFTTKALNLHLKLSHKQKKIANS